MENSTKTISIGLGVLVLGLGAYLYFKNKKEAVVGSVSNDVATGASVIAPSPVDVVSKATVAAVVVGVDNSLEARKISKEIFAKVNSLPNYKTSGSKKAMIDEINNWTEQMFNVGYAPDGKGGIIKISEVKEGNAPAVLLSKAILANVNKLPSYKTSGSISNINKDIYNLTQQMIAMGYVPDLKGGSYKIS
jgi:hypothetical protein